MGHLYVVGTPIGNLADLTVRAAETLKTVDFVICEDTRVTGKLLQHLDCRKPLVSLHQHSDRRAIDSALDRILAGESAALVTDAGTPGIADPGGVLVAMAHARQVSIVSIPGPSAVATALSVAGLPADQFLFLGFLPHKKGRQTLFGRIAETEETVVLYESPHRLLKTLAALVESIQERPIVVCRELTKLYESIKPGTAAELLAHYQQHPDEVRGEVVIIIGPTT